MNLLSAVVPLLIVALGQTLVIITGGIDLSATSVIALASVSGSLVMTRSFHDAVPGIAAMLVTGLLVGMLNGTAVAYLRMPPFIVTLTSMMFVSGLAVWITKSANVPGLPESFLNAGNSLWFALPATLLAGALSHWILQSTRLGQWLYAVGRNSRTAVASGVPVARTLLFAYAASALLAAGASVLYTARLETGSPVLGQRILLDVIAAVVIGGTSLFGGRGRMVWTLWGVLFIALIDNTLNLLGVSNFVVLVVKGLVILAAALLDRARRMYA